MPGWDRLIDIYGPWIVPAAMFFYYQLWPAVKEPLIARLRPERAEKRRQAIEQAEQAQRQEQYAREDRLLKVVENNTAAFTALQVMVASGTKANEQTAAAMRELAEDVAELRGQLNQPRRRRVKEPVDEVSA